MKNNKKGPDASAASDILKDLVDREQLNCKLRNPVLFEKPAGPAALYQDAGSGYNANYAFPQE